MLLLVTNFLEAAHTRVGAFDAGISLMIAVFSFVGENAKIEIWFVPGTIEPTQMNGAVASSETRLLHRRSMCETQIATNDRRIPIVEIRVANCTPVVGEQNLHSTGLNIFAVRQANVVDVLLCRENSLDYIPLVGSPLETDYIHQFLQICHCRISYNEVHNILSTQRRGVYNSITFDYFPPPCL